MHTLTIFYCTVQITVYHTRSPANAGSSLVDTAKMPGSEAATITEQHGYFITAYDEQLARNAMYEMFGNGARVNVTPCGSALL